MSDKFFNKILNFIGLEENIMEEDIEDEVAENVTRQQEELLEPNFQSKNRRGKVVNIHTSSYVKVVVYQPLSYDDTQSIVDNIKNRKPVVVNLENLDIDLAQRVLDFLSGAVYALDGSIQKVARGIFVLAPNNVDISGNIPDDMKGKTFFTISNKKAEE